MYVVLRIVWIIVVQDMSDVLDIFSGLAFQQEEKTKRIPVATMWTVSASMALCNVPLAELQISQDPNPSQGMATSFGPGESLENAA